MHTDIGMDESTSRDIGMGRVHTDRTRLIDVFQRVNMVSLLGQGDCNVQPALGNLMNPQ